jgi:hypothetical protein
MAVGMALAERGRKTDGIIYGPERRRGAMGLTGKR